MSSRLLPPRPPKRWEFLRKVVLTQRCRLNLEAETLVSKWFGARGNHYFMVRFR